MVCCMVMIRFRWSMMIKIFPTIITTAGAWRPGPLLTVIFCTAVQCAVPCRDVPHLWQHHQGHPSYPPQFCRLSEHDADLDRPLVHRTLSIQVSWCKVTLLALTVFAFCRGANYLIDPFTHKSNPIAWATQTGTFHLPFQQPPRPGWWPHVFETLSLSRSWSIGTAGTSFFGDPCWQVRCAWVIGVLLSAILF